MNRIRYALIDQFGDQVGGETDTAEELQTVARRHGLWIERRTYAWAIKSHVYTPAPWFPYPDGPEEEAPETELEEEARLDGERDAEAREEPQT